MAEAIDDTRSAVVATQIRAALALLRQGDLEEVALCVDHACNLTAEAIADPSQGWWHVLVWRTFTEALDAAPATAEAYA
jgi:hypothetical protein